MAKRKEQVMDGHPLTIAGTQFHVVPRYSAGHVLTEGEAAALNQTFYEAVRNNNATKVAEGKIDQDGITAYAESFQFGQRGAVVTDPVESMAMVIARKKAKAP